MEGKSCENCLFWLSLFAPLTDLPDGVCRRHTPDTKGTNSFPRVERDQWCGEYASKKLMLPDVDD